MHQIEQREIENAATSGLPAPKITMVFKEGQDQRCYNAPLNDEVAAVFVGEDGAPPGNHDIVIYPKDQELKNISYLNCNCDPMIYPLLFPTGQMGWHSSMRHNMERQTKVRTKVTQLQYYSFMLAIRPGFCVIQKSGKLFHQYMVDAYVKMEA